MSTKIFVLEDYSMRTPAPGLLPPAETNWEPRAVFSIDGNNFLHGTIWITKNGEFYATNLVTASYVVRDKFDNAPGLSETLIPSSVSGLFHITPVNANALLDLNHYTVEISVSADGDNHIGQVGITFGD